MLNRLVDKDIIYIEGVFWQDKTTISQQLGPIYQ